MATVVQHRRANTEVNSSYVGAEGEITVDNQAWSIRVHDYSTPGGHEIGSIAANLASEPATGRPGQMYYNTITGKFRGWNGVTNAWVDLG